MNILNNIVFVLVILVALHWIFNVIGVICIGTYHVFIPRSQRKKDFSFLFNYMCYSTLCLFLLYLGLIKFLDLSV